MLNGVRIIYKKTNVETRQIPQLFGRKRCANPLLKIALIIFQLCRLQFWTYAITARTQRCASSRKYASRSVACKCLQRQMALLHQFPLVPQSSLLEMHPASVMQNFDKQTPSNSVTSLHSFVPYSIATARIHTHTHTSKRTCTASAQTQTASILSFSNCTAGGWMGWCSVDADGKETLPNGITSNELCSNKLTYCKNASNWQTIIWMMPNERTQRRRWNEKQEGIMKLIVRLFVAAKGYMRKVAEYKVFDFVASLLWVWLLGCWLCGTEFDSNCWILRHP